MKFGPIAPKKRNVSATDLIAALPTPIRRQQARKVAAPGPARPPGPPRPEISNGVPEYRQGTTNIRPHVGLKTLRNKRTQVEALVTLNFDDPSLFKEQLTQTTELLITQGVQSISEICHIYPGVSPEDAKAAIDAAKLRFEVSGSLFTTRENLGLMLGKLRYMETQLWHDYREAANKPKERQMVIGSLLQVWDKQAVMQGLTSNQINMFLEVKEDSLVVGKMQGQGRLIDAFANLAEKIKQIETQQANVIDVPAENCG